MLALGRLGCVGCEGPFQVAHNSLFQNFFLTSSCEKLDTSTVSSTQMLLQIEINSRNL